MTRLESVRTLVFVVLVALAGGSEGRGQSASITGGPLRKHPTNPRYFTDDSGRAIYLMGSHFWSTIQERNEAKTESRGLKLLRPFRSILISSSPGTTTSPGCGASITSILRARLIRGYGPGSGSAFDGKPKWDVSKVSQVCLDRLQDRVRQFRDNGIYVSVMFFKGNSLKGTAWKENAAVVREINRVTRGWSNYFALAHYQWSFKQMNYFVAHRLRQWLWRKHGNAVGKFSRWPDCVLFRTYGLFRLPSHLE